MIFKRAQISMEYLILVGFVVFLVIGILGASFYYTLGVEDKIRSDQLVNFANKIISSAESVYFSGEPSRITVNAYLPGGIEDIRIVDDNGESVIVFDVQTSSGFATIAFTSDVPLDTSATLSRNEGLKRIQLVTTDTEVTIIEG